MRRTLKSRLTRLEKQAVSPKYEVLWVDIHGGETHEGMIVITPESTASRTVPIALWVIDSDLEVSTAAGEHTFLVRLT